MVVLSAEQRHIHNDWVFIRVLQVGVEQFLLNLHQELVRSGQEGTKLAENLLFEQLVLLVLRLY